jgi:hypothetical protein
MTDEDIIFCVLGAFQVWETKGLINESEAKDLIQFANSKTCDTLCKVLNKIGRLEVEGSAGGEESHRAVGIGKAEAMFQLVDHLAVLRDVLKAKNDIPFDPTKF